MPDIVAKAQKDTLELTNQVRAKEGKAPLGTCAALNQAAQVRAIEMAATHVMSHTRPDGSQCFTVLKQNGWYMGENVAAFTVPTTELGAMAVDMWNKSPGHHRNMVNGNFRFLGSGYAQASDGTWFCCQLFTGSDDIYWVDTPKVTISTPTPAPTPTATPTASPTWPLFPTRTPAPTWTPGPTRTATPVRTPAPIPSVTPPPVKTATPSPRPTVSASPSASPSASRTASPTAAPSPTMAPPPTAGPTHSVEGVTFPEPSDTHFEVSENGSITIEGLTATHPTQDRNTVNDVLETMTLPEGVTAQVYSQDDQLVSGDRPASTGQVIRFVDADGNTTFKATMVVKGDVLGTGQSSLTQLTRTAASYVGADPLEGPFLAAADINGDGELTLTDLVRIANMTVRDGVLG